MSSQFWKLLSKHYDNPTKFSLPDGGDVWIKKYKNELSHLSHNEAFFLFRNGLNSPPTHDCGTRLEFDIKTYKYKKTCPACGRAAHNKQSIEVNGVIYKSKTEARDILGLSVYELDKNIISSEIIDRYSRNGVISKEILQDRISNRKTMKEISKEFSISYESLSFLFDVYQLPKKWCQLDETTYLFLYDRDRFVKEFSQSNSEELASKYSCSPSTILQWADKYQIDRTERFQSAIERELIEYIKTLDSTLTVLPRDKSIGMEIDILIPSKKIGIELDGLYYHSDASPKDNRNKHQEKQKLAYKHGITLLRFVDIGETNGKLDIVKSIIKSKLGYNKKVFARKCKCVEIKSSIGNDFFRQNHISGSANASVYIGLLLDGDLIEVCSFSAPRFDQTYEWEIIRLASKQGVTVVGGLSKIISFFRKSHPGSIMTYANLRFGNGNGYTQSGFRYVGISDPGYFYTDMKRTYSRHMFRKDTIKRLIPNADLSKTELEIAYEHGFRRYKDCGNAKFVLD